MKCFASRWTLLIAANVALWCVLGVYQFGEAQSKSPQLPFANSNEQRSEIVQELREIKLLLKETNSLLREQAQHAATAKPVR
jgi:hypothetical protein